MGNMTELTNETFATAELMPETNTILGSAQAKDLVELSNTKDYFVSQFNALAAKTAKSTIEMCKVVYDAKQALKCEFAKFCEAIGRDSGDSTIRKYLAIGEAYPRLKDYTDRLPNAWTSIYLITQIPSEQFNELIEEKRDLSQLTGHAIKQLTGKTEQGINEANNKAPSALIYLKREPTVAQWNYFRVVLNKIISECKDLELHCETTPRYRKLIKDLKKENREKAKRARQTKKEVQKQTDERDCVYRPDLFDYGDSFDKEKGGFV